MKMRNLAMLAMAVALAVSFDAAAANAYRVEATLMHGGHPLAAPTAVEGACAWLAARQQLHVYHK